MYGLIIENFLTYLRDNFHKKRVEEILELAKLGFEEANIGRVYPEGIVARIRSKACLVLQMSEPELCENVGVHFVKLYRKLGLSSTVERIGRHFRDLIINLDNCHDYFRLRFPGMHSPSFFVESESAEGLVLVYRSKRRGFAYYVCGQMRQLAKSIYDIDVQIRVCSQEIVFDAVEVVFELKFFNSCFVNCRSLFKAQTEADLPIRASMMLNMFPFAIVFEADDQMNIAITGHSLTSIAPDIINRGMKEVFDLVRPLVEFAAQPMLKRANNVFLFRLKRRSNDAENENSDNDENEKEDNNEEKGKTDQLLLRGQLMWMSEWRRVLFFGSPMVETLADLLQSGLRLNDLAMHDYSRETLLNSTQRDLEVRLAEVIREQRKNDLTTMEQTMEQTLKESDNRIEQSFSVPIRVLAKEKTDRTWHVDQLSVLCARIYNFDSMLSRAEDAYEVISLVDNLASAFDYLVEYRQAVSISATDTLVAVSNFLNSSKQHSESMAKLALELNLGVSQTMREPRPLSRPLRLTIALNVGPALISLVQWGKRSNRELSVHGKALSDCIELLDEANRACVMVTERCREILANRQFKLNLVKINSNKRVWTLDEKQRHRALSFVGLMTAYTRFKHRRSSYEQHHYNEFAPVNNACGGFAGSKVCSLQ